MYKVMNIQKNPYRPGVGLQPPVLAGREPELSRFKRILRSSPEIPGNVRLSGLRGVGKTVLLSRLADLASEENWSVIQLEVQPSMNNELSLTNELDRNVATLIKNLSTVAKVRARAGELVEVVRRSARVSYEGFEWSIAGDIAAESKAIGNLLAKAVEASEKQGRLGLVLLLDEAQVLTDDTKPDGAHALSSLVAAVSTLQKAGVAISLVLCGLPTLAVNLMKARTYTERMFQGIEVGSLDTAAARRAFVEPIEGSHLTIEEKLIDQVLDQVDGYPYFIQLWGAELWDATMEAGLPEISSATLDTISGRIYERLDVDFYEPRVASLRPAEQDVLIDSAQCSYPPIMVADINAQSPKSPGNINVLLGRLVEANVLFRVRKGQYKYTAPGFRDYLLRRSVANQ